MFSRAPIWAGIFLLAVSIFGCAAEERPLDRRLRLAAESRPRPIEGRLSASRKYSRFTGSPVPASLANLEDKVAGSTTRGRGGDPGGREPRDLHLRGLLSVFRSELEIGVAELEHAAEQAPSASVLSDLAATYLALAEDRSPWLLVDATTAASAAVEKDPLDTRAAFNLALALERLSLVHESALAWEHYQAIETDAVWLQEAAGHLNRLKRPALADNWPKVRIQVLTAASSGNFASSLNLARDYPRPYRDLVERELLPAWAAAFGTEDASNALATARTAAAAVAANGERLYLDQVARIETSPQDQKLAEAHKVLAQGFEARADCSRAASLFDRAAAQLEKLESPMASVAHLELLICLYREAPKKAEAALKELEAKLQGKRYPTLLAKVKVMRGLAAMNAGRHSDAMVSYSEAIELYRPSDTERARLLGVLDEANFYAGDRQTAWRYRLNALAGAAAGGDRRLRHATLMTMALDLLQSEGGSVTRHVLAEMLANARAWGEPGVEAEILLRKLPLDIKSGDPKVEQEIAACARALEAMSQPADRERLASELEIVKAEYEMDGNPAAAASLLEAALAKLGEIGYGLLDARALLALGRARLALNDIDGAAESFDSALKIYEDRRQKTADDRRRITYFATAQEGFDAMIRLQAIERKDAQAAFLYAERIRARGLRDRQLSAAEVVKQEPFQSRLDRIPANARVLSFVVLPEQLLIFQLDRGSLSLVTSPYGRAELAALVGKVNASLQSGHLGSAKKAAADAFDAILADALQDLPTESDLFLLPDRELFALPYAGLFNARTGRFLVEDHPITIAADLDAVLNSEKIFPYQDIGKILVVGAPAFDSELFPHMPQLPGAVEEANAIAALHPKSIELMTGRDATRSQILAALPSSEIFHLAAHVELDPRDPFDSVIPTAAPDPPLRAADLDRKTMSNIRLVFLSACNTAPGFPEGDREGTAGLARAVQVAGVPSVVATLWAIDDRSAAAVAPIFYSRLLAGGSPTQALRSAQIIQIQNLSQTAPFAWTSFQIYRGS